MQANEHVQQHQKEATTNFIRPTDYIPKTGRETPTRKSTNSDEFQFIFPDSSDHVQLRGEASKIISTVTEHNLLQQRELSRVSSTSTESYHLREISMSTDAITKEPRRDSHVSTSSSDHPPSSPPVLHIDNTKVIYETQRGCLTLPLQKKSSQPRYSPAFLFCTHS